MIIEIELTEKEADELVQILAWQTDVGSSSEGWQSKDLAALSRKVDESVEKAKAS